MKVQFNKHPSTEEISFLTEQINEQTSECGKASTFGPFIKGDNGCIIAGCNGSIHLWSNLYRSKLWVDLKYQKQRIVRDLMNHVHKYGKVYHCQLATIASMSFQSVSFYEKLGYNIDFSRNGYVNNSQLIFL